MYILVQNIKIYEKYEHSVQLKFEEIYYMEKKVIQLQTRIAFLHHKTYICGNGLVYFDL